MVSERPFKIALVDIVAVLIVLVAYFTFGWKYVAVLAIIGITSMLYIVKFEFKQDDKKEFLEHPIWGCYLLISWGWLHLLSEALFGKENHRLYIEYKAREE